MGTSKTRMASLQMRIIKNWTNRSEWKVMFLLSKQHQNLWDVRHRVGHGLDTLTMEKDRMDRLNHDGLSANPHRQTKKQYEIASSEGTRKRKRKVDAGRMVGNTQGTCTNKNQKKR